MTEKLTVLEQAELRKDIYAIAIKALEEKFETGPISDGVLIYCGDGQYASLKVTYKDPTKFDLEATIAEYDEKVAKEAERAEKAIEAAAKKAEKATEKAKKDAEKADPSPIKPVETPSADF